MADPDLQIRRVEGLRCGAGGGHPDLQIRRGEGLRCGAGGGHPDLQIRRGEGLRCGAGGGHPDFETKRGSPVSKTFLRPFGPQFGLKIGGGGGGGGGFLESLHYFCAISLSSTPKKMRCWAN